ncbi:DUF3861 domain-containing protein [Chryseobacterium sp. CT-SW4]|uniref:DUF3861 domain-containing protein n=1 Tax=Chryseobacterium sp. SW-1 TaxID=3157343 RepID=UPI003B02D154
MEKKAYQYKLTLEYLKDNNGLPVDEKPVEFEFKNHDPIFSIIEMMKKRDFFDNPSQSVEFAVGLKLFSDVMMKNRNNPLFEELLPAFGNFMKKMKSSIK